MAFGEWSLPVLILTYKPFIVFSLPHPIVEGGDREASVGQPASAHHIQISLAAYFIQSSVNLRCSCSQTRLTTQSFRGKERRLWKSQFSKNYTIQTGKESLYAVLEKVLMDKAWNYRTCGLLDHKIFLFKYSWHT